jgi:protein-tyrosine kinase
MNQGPIYQPETKRIPGDRPSRFTMREITARLFFRFKLFLACVILIPVLCVFFASIVPPKYKATAKVLIGYDESVSPYFKEIVIAKRQIISGQSNAEILKSLPVCFQVVKGLELQPSDIAKPAFKVISAYLAGPFYSLFGTHSEKTAPSRDEEAMQLAREFQNTISPNIILKGRQEIEVNNELIEVTVESFNHEKVATMTNRLCNEFIAEYYRLYAEEAKRAHSYLAQQIERIEKEILNGDYENLRIYQLPDRSATTGERSGGKWSERNVNDNPIVESISRQVAELESELGRLRATFSPGSPEVIKIQTQLTTARNRLRSHKAKESTEAVLNILKEKQQQAEMSLQIYQKGLIPISLVEEAVTPKKASAWLMMRYPLFGGMGLFAGLVIGIVMVMFFSAIDNRIYTPWDAENTYGCNVIGSIPEIARMDRSLHENDELPLKEAAGAVMGVLGRLDLIGSGKGIVLVVTGPSRGEGKTSTALQIAGAIAHDQRVKILVVDANFENPDLSTMLSQGSPTADQQKGLIDFFKGEVLIHDLIVNTKLSNLDLLPAGLNRKRHTLGFFKKSLKKALQDMRSDYDLIVVDTPGLLLSTDASMFASESDYAVMVIKSGVTRREILAKSIGIEQESGVRFLGVLMNFRRYPIPRIFYRQG